MPSSLKYYYYELHKSLIYWYYELQNMGLPRPFLFHKIVSSTTRRQDNMWLANLSPNPLFFLLGYKEDNKFLKLSHE